jgi:hypothetical protein
VLSLEKVCSLLVICGYDVASWNHSFYQRLRCSGEDLCLWMGENGVALSMVKRAHVHYSNKDFTFNRKNFFDSMNKLKRKEACCSFDKGLVSP